MSREWRFYLEDMREACEKVLRYVGGMTFEQFVQDEKTFDAVVRNLEILGEAAKHILPEVRICYPDVEWPRIAGLRDVIAHRYFGIDEDILWDIVKNQIPVLLERVQWILAQESE